MTQAAPYDRAQWRFQSMNYVACPTEVVEAPVEFVWGLLTRPQGWGDFYDVRIVSVVPPGSAHVGQQVSAESGPALLHLTLSFRFTRVDHEKFELGFEARFPLGITVREDLGCVALGPARCRVNYHCDFGFPPGWRGALVRLILRGELRSGPVDSLLRLKRAAERKYANGTAAEAAKSQAMKSV
jgi:hypothetical protein